ncbi:valine--tRNA ligase [Geobacter sulfurreducens]|jgi:valyl-tRNA synthetase|uniref:Valine--tRNA ligase n=1 Tax=Geobacter sulfurreducens (strain ATCC 51573 / DSM 12127 / PCA) TaxID=243231 RepID=SYV_GEOSL|nr:valine--tRNA ligase [Geobacter sulfurreducens]Q74BJ6.1 RecName: Full=Valine--tRNA ligase; AltName: Full=Valyl-tRNA synthetase; Short=ValRS [Geobacter sulfurreducens PCA]AAR35421.1 valyl-tRNA synthetase [Geobacter sulfurreducens PCA]ADI84879.1 valyl-tRNA synthetase [Geobacter sulfurreducens KN400]AJY68274.1 valyl-tRNA synthetase [Geobacter sulfurreducens]QVW33986.1 valine--tRNA ligase [Geobacter sulfurreducens]UAC02775.1 valine--tRNA ligase [Geobacter sulfurreducens]
MAEKELAKVYEPTAVERKWYETWEQEGYFRANPDSGKPSYSIVIPPPNVTGALHMGHALNNTLQDILCRWKRMNGYEVLWMPGTDHAGIATQNVVERQLAGEGTSRHELGREAFIERVWKWKAESGGQIIGQLKRLGASCDWGRERFTMDEGLSRAVREVFVRLYEEGLIYRDNRLINWCPRCHTALSDIEVEHEDKAGNLWHIRYPVVGEPGRFVVVATTRPETMLGDTAVAVHPEDERYADLVGKKVLLPLVNREIPVVADGYVDREFGTGVVKITPAHDFNDFEVGRRHNLDLLNVFDESAVVNSAGHQYEGMERFAARKRVVEDLEALGLLEKIDDHAHAVGGCYRCKTVVEPYLSLQWYVKVGPLAERALAAVKDGRTRIVPQQWENTYYDWMENIKDWCISRQIWWGHRIPAWYCDHCGETTVAKIDPTVCAACGSDEIRQETDVLDTWFSSALWPFSTMGWPDRTPELAAFYPTSCLVTGFDILFFWVARMMMMGLHFMNEVPFSDVYIHALVRDAQGQKMSKSKGNVIDPLVVIDQYGTDAFRFTLAAFAAQGRDIKLAEERIAGYRNFVNKIWNASRFALMNLEGFEPDTVDPATLDLSNADRWILHRLNSAAAETAEALEAYRFNDAAGTLYRFTWSEFCDWYIELAKDDLYRGDDARKETARYVLWLVLENLLRLLHPFMPFITEEIWQTLPGARPAPSIMVAGYPRSVPERDFPDGAAEMELVMEVIRGIRNIRGEMDVAPSREIAAILSCGSAESLHLLKRNEVYVMSLARLSDLAIGQQLERPADAAIQVAGDVEIAVPLKGLVNVEEEEKRLLKEIGKLDKEIEMFGRKLENPSFVERAPADVVAKEREKLAEVTQKKDVLLASLEKIRKLA